jgi:hypothetical protein
VDSALDYQYGNHGSTIHCDGSMIPLINCSMINGEYYREDWVLGLRARILRILATVSFTTATSSTERGGARSKSKTHDKSYYCGDGCKAEPEF